MKMMGLMLSLIVLVLFSVSVLGIVIRISGDNQNTIVNRNYTLPNNPIQFGENITVNANVTDDNDTIQWVNFTLIAPSNAIVINNVNGTRVGDIWNSTQWTINESGFWNYSIISQDDNPINQSPFVINTSVNVTDMLYHSPAEIMAVVPLNYNLTYTFNLWTSTRLPLNWTVNTTLGENFTVTFNQTNIMINSTQYNSLQVNISSIATAVSGQYNGSLVFRRQFPYNTTAEATHLVLVNITVADSYGDIEFVDPEDYVFTICSGTVSHSIPVTNLGNYILTECTPYLYDSDLTVVATGTEFSLDAGEESTAHISYNYGGGTVQTFFAVECIASTSGAKDKTSSDPTITFNQAANCGGSGGGGGGTPYIPPKAEEQAPVNITYKCGNGICDESDGETYDNCILDCASKQFKLEDIFCMPLLNCGSWKQSWFTNIVIFGLIGGLVYFGYEGRKSGRLRS